MNIEFARFLHSLVSESDEILPKGLSADFQRSLASSIPAIYHGVSGCPREIDAVLSSKIAFMLSRELRKNTGSLEKDKTSPEGLAGSIAEAARGNPFFHVSVGGLGHINIVPSDLFVLEYLNSLSANGYRRLFQDQAIVVLETKGAPLFGPRDFICDWGRVFARGRKSKDEQIIRFSKELEGKKELVADEKIMLLSLLADSELEIEPYRQGLFGRQNIPWYLRRFLKDWRVFVKNCGEKGVEGRCLGLGWSLGLGSENEASLFFDSLLGRLVRYLLMFRSVVFRAEYEKRPELLVGHILLIIRVFYSYYNHPQMRGLRGLSSEELTNFTELTKVAGSAVEHSLNLLEFSC